MWAAPRARERLKGLAPNGSLILNSRGPVQGVRWQSVSSDAGDTWSAPRVLDFGFGSSCEGSILRPVEGRNLLLFAHAGRVDGVYGRFNLSVWASRDSGASWHAFHMAEAGMNATQLRALHTAYSSMLPLNATHVALVYERGPMGSRVGAGEYATPRIR